MAAAERTEALQTPLGRRDLFKMAGAAAGAAALATSGPRVGSAAPSAAQDGASTLIFAFGTDVDELDPRQIDTQEGYIACSNVYDCLVLYDYGATTIRPGLAETWEISEDGLEYTFHLRQGVTFHDGTTFNADAVVTWFNSMVEGAPGSQYDPTKMVYAQDFLTSRIDRVEKVDDATVKLVLPIPYAPLLANLAIPIASIVSPTAIALGLDEVAVSPSGTGAFMLANRDDWTRTTGAARRRSSG
jgi:peptide/nickel transport system substrate-binding protein